MLCVLRTLGWASRRMRSPNARAAPRTRLPARRVYVKYEGSGEAARCVDMMNGRQFDDRTVRAGRAATRCCWAAAGPRAAAAGLPAAPSCVVKVDCLTPNPRRPSPACLPSQTRSPPQIKAVFVTEVEYKRSNNGEWFTGVIPEERPAALAPGGVAGPGSSSLTGLPTIQL